MRVGFVADQLVEWLKAQVGAAGLKGAVCGLSGGIDSAVVAALAQRAFGDEFSTFIMPCHSLPEDRLDAEAVAGALGIHTEVIDLSAAYDALVAAFGVAGADPRSNLALANIKPRLRMITLYYQAQSRKALVLGTGNRDEVTVGYATKYGDAGVDLQPLAGLVKGQVYELGRYLGVPDKVVSKAPSAGLWAGQTDEGEMGLTYADLDRYLLTGEGSQTLMDKVAIMHARSEHKRMLPPQPALDLTD
jgi:NAD+ synthase